MTQYPKEARVSQPDDLFEALVDAHENLTDSESRQLNSRLILLLANLVGDLDQVLTAIDKARSSITAEQKQ
ncbi:MAG: DUF2783 domain-containing protein [Rhodospirillales bacterium]